MIAIAVFLGFALGSLFAEAFNTDVHIIKSGDTVRLKRDCYQHSETETACEAVMDNLEIEKTTTEEK
jgi:hypothetical protein